MDHIINGKAAGGGACRKYSLHKFLFALLVISAACIPAQAQTKEQPAGNGSSGSTVSTSSPRLDRRNIIFEKQTQYFLVTVLEENRGLRHLVFNPCRGSQGILDPKHPDALISDYCRFTSIFLAAMDRKPGRILFIGLGAGILPRFVRKNFPETQIDIVEIDREIPGIAEKYFLFRKDDRISIHIADGRDFINRARDKYDVIFIDAYNAECIPFQLTTLEFFGKIRAALAPGGLMTANIANLGKMDFIRSEIRTAAEIFPDLAIFIAPDSSNYILFARNDGKLDGKKLREKAQEFDRNTDQDFRMADLLDSRMTDDERNEMTGDAKILRDDFAPVETMR